MLRLMLLALFASTLFAKPVGLDKGKLFYVSKESRFAKAKNNTFTYESLMQCEPAIKARFMYYAQRGIYMQPLESLHAGTNYSCAFNKTFFPKEKEKTFTFKTVDFALNEVRFFEHERAFRLFFNDEVKAKDIKPFLSFKEAQDFGLRVEGRVAVLSLTKPTQQKSLELEVKQGLPSLYGATLTQPKSLLVGSKEEPLFEYDAKKSSLIFLDEPKAVALKNGDLALRVYFPKHVKVQEAKKYIQVKGVSKVRLSRARYVSYNMRQKLKGKSNYYVDVQADFEPLKTYELVLKAGLATYKNQLREDTSYTLTTPDKVSVVRFDVQKPYISSKGEIAFESLNTESVNLVVHKLLDENFRYFASLERGASYKVPSLSKEVYSKNFSLSSPKNQWKRHSFSLKELFKEQASGVYKLFLHYGDKRVSSSIVYYSDLGLSVKLSQEQLFVSVASLSEAKAIANAKVSLFSNKNELLATTYSKEDGVAVFEEAGLLSKNPVAVVVEHENDKNFLVLNQLVNKKTYAKDRGKNASFKGFVYFQSALLRPGQSLNALLVLKNKNFLSAKDLPVRVKVSDPSWKVVYEKAHTLNDVGSLSLHLPMQKSFKTGTYRFEVFANERLVASEIFSIEAFVPQNIKNEIRLPKEVKVDEYFKAALKSTYLFGAPVANKTAKLRFTAVGASYKPSKYEAYRFTNRFLAKENVRSYLDKKEEIRLNNNGEYELLYKLAIKQNPPSMLKAQVAFTVDVDGRKTAAYKTFDLYTYSAMVGVQIENTQLESAKRLKAHTLLVEPRSQKPKKGKLFAQLFRIQWHYTYDKTNKHYKWSQEKSLVESQEIEAGSVYERVMHQSGNYVLQLTDLISGHSTTQDFRVSGWDYSTLSPTDDLSANEVHFEDKLYKKGDTLALSITSPINKGRLLVSIEDEKVLWHKVIRLEKGSASLNVDLDFDLGNGVYVNTLAVKSTAKAAGLIPYRARSSNFVKVDKNAFKLSPKITAKTLSKSKQKNFKIALSGAKDAYVLVSVADEGILQIIGQEPPKPFAFFNTQPKERVGLYDLYDKVMQDQHKAQRLHFGGDERLMKKMRKHLAPKRSAERVKPFVYWSKLVKADENGEATFFMDIPRFNGKAKIVAIAISKEGIGSSHQELIVRDDIVLKPVYPRFMLRGDALTVPVRVFNTTEKAQNLNLVVKTNEALSASLEQASLQVAPKSSALVNMRVEAKGVGKAELLLQAQVGEKRFEDAVELAIQEPYSLFTKVYQGDTNTQKRINIDKEYATKGARMSIALSSSYLSRLQTSVFELINYPYGCTEQTSSKLLALTYSKPFLNGLKEKERLALSEDKNRFINEGILKLQALQNYRGEFAYWDEGSYVNAFASVYASDVLFNLKEQGFEVPATVLQKAQSSLTSISKGEGSFHYGRVSKFLQLYAAYVLSNMKALEHSVANYLYDNKYHENSFLSAYLMAGILDNVGSQSLAKELMAKQEPNFYTKLPSKRSLSQSFYSKERDLAFALWLYVRHFGKDAHAHTLLQELSKSFESLHSTQDRAFSLRALVAYYGDEAPKGIDAKVRFNKQTFKVQKDFSTEAEVKSSTLEFSSNNNESFNYAVSVSQYLKKPVKHKLDTFTKTFNVYRRFVDTRSNRIKLEKLKVGDVIYSRVYLSSAKAIDNLVVAERIPSCFEVINERLEKRLRPYSVRDSKNFKADYQDIRDDRVLTFLSMKQPKRYRTTRIEYYTPLRVVNAGSCQLPALVAEAMYDERISDYDKEQDFLEVRLK